ncbi:MAG: Fur family transcriptional regulator [Prevotellaceae bacterium]|nr:Fur family transcriptional regulator [Prevotellaceae bacterium]
MNQQETIALLQQHDIKPTANRMVIVKALSETSGPVTMKELEYKILSIDKSGIFRALQLFRDHHLVHVIDDGNGSQRFELCYSGEHDVDDDEHAHFYCEQCHRVYCLPDIPIPAVDLPEGYVFRDASLLIRGICPSCQKKGPHALR